MLEDSQYINHNDWTLNAVQIHITDHCNLNCAGCFHFAPLAPEKIYPYESIKKDLLQLKSLTKDRGLEVALLGGEPLLHPQFLEICQLVKDIFPDNTHWVITNGLLLKQQSQEFFNKFNKLGFRIE